VAHKRNVRAAGRALVKPGKPYGPETLIGQVAHMLGLEVPVFSDLELARQVEQGLPVSSIDSLREDAQLESEVIYKLVLNRRTLSRRQAEEALEPDESDRVVRLARIIALTRQTFPGAPDYAEQWLREPKRHLEGRTPLDLLATESGARVVEEMLLQTQEGVFA
jgi:putative toxin-antitoxin system antitoxin component (TIGR02293 family)